MAAFYKKIPVSHVEAGLRTWNRFAPFPEEMNRVLISRLAGFHFCPTPWSRDNLLKEGIGADRIIVTGNTVVDAIQAILGRVRKHPPDISSLANTIFNRDRFSKFVLITGHRRENFGAGFKNVCAALSALAEQFSSTAFVYPLHLNPNVQKPVREMLGHSGNIFLIPPQDYLQFVYLMDYSDFIITDSGGVQEEAPSLGKPVLVMRESTERPEAVQSGNVKIVGTSVEKIVSNAKRLLTDEDFYRSMSIVSDVYGDGKASIRIIDAIARHFSNPTRNTEPVDA
jgi:UDP-N-acetylglucosamine 2-epimerase (non-hydrolysing)